MKLSTKGRYGLKAIIDIGLYENAGSVSISDIAKRESISENYLEKLARLMKSSGLIQSKRGARGGYVLAKDASNISVGDVLRSLEGDIRLVDCNGKDNTDCNQVDKCVTKDIWQILNDSVSKAVDNIKLSDVINKKQNICNNNCNLENSICNFNCNKCNG